MRCLSIEVCVEEVANLREADVDISGSSACTEVLEESSVVEKVLSRYPSERTCIVC